MTDRYGVIGHPINHSKSPVIHGQFAAQTNQDISYEAFDITPEDLLSAINKLVDAGIKGLNVTVPLKNGVKELMDELSDRALLAGAVNTIQVQNDGTLTGDNTDGVGLIRDLHDNLGIELEGSTVLILGAGGATRGIIPALLESGTAEILIANRTVEKATDLAAQFSRVGQISACRFDELSDRHFDLIINATSAGLQGEVPPFPAAIISSDTVVYDLSYAMTDTPFTVWAREHGAEQVHQGWGMLVEQAAESFFIWRGVRPETEPVRTRLP
jgi:shikimate dehydrogenase